MIRGMSIKGRVYSRRELASVLSQQQHLLKECLCCSTVSSGSAWHTDRPDRLTALL